MSSTTVTRMLQCRDELKWQIQDMTDVFSLDCANTIGSVESHEYEVGRATGLHSKWILNLRGANGTLSFGVCMKKFCVSEDRDRFKYGDDLPFILCKYDISLSSSPDAPPFKTVSKPKHCHSLEDRTDPSTLDPYEPHPLPYEFTEIMPVTDFVTNQVEYFPNNTLYIDVIMTLFFQPISVELGSMKFANYIEEHAKKTFVEFANTLFNNAEMSDVLVSCNGGRTVFNAHRVILSGRSVWFRTRLSDHWIQTNPEARVAGGNAIKVDMDDEDASTVEIMLRFIYGAEFHVPEVVAKEELLRLVGVANKYTLDELKTACFYKMLVGLNEDNAGEFAQAAYLYHANLDCKNYIQSYCLSRHAQLVKNERYNEIYRNFPEAFLE